MRAIVAILIVVVGCKSEPRPITDPGRPQAAKCPKERPKGTANPEIQGSCKTDDDCKTGMNGRCQLGGSRVQTNACTYDACFLDTDCKGGPCECSESGNRCLEGNCKTNADCGAGGACGRSNSMGCWGGDASYYCRTKDDSCSSSEDCGGKGQCVYLPELGHWGCKVYPDCPVG